MLVHGFILFYYNKHDVINCFNSYNRGMTM